MAEVVNLRLARKRAARAKAEVAAKENRLAHGASRHERELTQARRDDAESKLDAHRLEPGEPR
jgi:hypothetical protein